jgi:hypothetical protein
MANNWASIGGSGVQYMDPTTGRMIDSDSPEGVRYLQNARTRAAQTMQGQLTAQQNLAGAEVEADAQEFEANQNREQGNQAFQLALSQSGNRRQPGGGIARGAYGRRGISLNSATGGLAAANANARRMAQGKLASARVAADPANQQLQQQIGLLKAAGTTPGANKISVPKVR